MTALLMPSPHDADNGELIGRDPREVSPDAMREAGHGLSPIKAIRAKCIDCSGGSESEARKCVAVGCPLWPFRMGKNVFHAKREMTDEERAAMAERLARARATR